jgi:tetratricopeptide (TPR) repeat protein
MHKLKMNELKNQIKKNIQINKDEELERQYKKIVSDNIKSNDLADFAVIEAQNKNYDLALIFISEALKKEPLNQNYSSNYASILIEAGYYEEAVNILNALIKSEPENYLFRINRVSAYIELNRNLEALIDCDYLISNNNNENKSDAWSKRGLALGNLYQLEESLLSYQKALNLDLTNYEANINKANLLYELKRNTEAIVAFQKTIDLYPNSSEVWSNIGSVYHDQNELKISENCYQMSLSLDQHNSDAWNNYGELMVELAEFIQAMKFFDNAIEIDNNEKAIFNKSLLLLRNGNILDGFTLYETRWDLEEFKKNKRQYQKPRWNGNESIFNKKILIYAEQGLGDTIQFIRYIKDIAIKGASVTLQVPKVLIKLLDEYKKFADIKAIEINEEIEYDYHCPLMSLPLALGGIGIYQPYLNPNLKLVDKWKKILGSSGFKIAICWQGNPDGRVDIGRSFSPLEFKKISNINNVRLISLQKNYQELNSQLKIEKLPEEFDMNGDAFVDSAAIMQSVDLVITSDTALTHLAGAMGVKTWLVLKYMPDWRWMLDDKSLWYANHRLFRQTCRGDWTSVFTKIENEIQSIINDSKKFK